MVDNALSGDVRGKTPFERLRGRPYQGQVAEFAEVVHFRDPGKAVDMPKLDDRWNLGLWLGKSLASPIRERRTTVGNQECHCATEIVN